MLNPLGRWHRATRHAAVTPRRRRNQIVHRFWLAGFTSEGYATNPLTMDHKPDHSTNMHDGSAATQECAVVDVGGVWRRVRPGNAKSRIAVGVSDLGRTGAAARSVSPVFPQKTRQRRLTKLTGQLRFSIAAAA
jgi:hypothetical protein